MANKITIRRVDGEYVVRLWRDGKMYEPATYFTNDAEDAVVTAFDMAKRNDAEFKMPPALVKHAASLRSPPLSRAFAGLSGGLTTMPERCRFCESPMRNGICTRCGKPAGRPYKSNKDVRRASEIVKAARKKA